jgi:hypothetical protein
MTQQQSNYGYCGIDCSQCPAYLSTIQDDMEGLLKLSKEWSSPDMAFSQEEIKCFGCHQTKKCFSWCAECSVRRCAMEKNLENCAYCKDYPCETIQMPHSKSPEAKKYLDKIYQTIQ